MVSHSGFNLHFPDNQSCWTSFPVLVIHSYVMFYKEYIQIFCPFKKIELLLFIYSGYKPFIWYLHCKYFLLDCGLLFIFLIVSFKMQNFFLMKSNLSVFSPAVYAFVSCPWNLCLPQLWICSVTLLAICSFSF